MVDYFSDRERGPRPRTKEEILPAAWGGFVALIGSLIETGALGLDFPETCPDGFGCVGTDQGALSLGLQAEIPEIMWPLQTSNLPETPAILDLLEFVHSHVAAPIEGSFHDFFRHSHLGFNRDLGQQNFRERVNRIFARNGIAFELGHTGQILRMAPMVLRERLASTEFATGDSTLDSLLESARNKYLSPDIATRRDALEKLWDAWERTKTLFLPQDKKISMKVLLDAATSETHFRALLETEARELTRIGNTFRIRHSEATQISIGQSEHIDYLFHRMFALLSLLLDGFKSPKAKQ